MAEMTKPISDEEYRRRYEQEVARVVSRSGPPYGLGGGGMRNGEWVSIKHDAYGRWAWHWYAGLLQERGLWTGTFKAMRPDGSWREWSPGEMAPQD